MLFCTPLWCWDMTPNVRISKEVICRASEKAGNIFIEGTIRSGEKFFSFRKMLLD